MAVEYIVVSIGTLSHNHFWGEHGAVRTPHATSTLVRSGERLILVDPSLPPVAMESRFGERCGKRLADVTDVFCTTLRMAHRRGIEAMPHARWWASAAELEWFRQALEDDLDSARRLGGEDAAALESELKLLDRFAPCPQELCDQVTCYPMPGASAGSTGLLLTPALGTIVIAGDAALTGEHILAGQVWEGCLDKDAAMASLTDMLELADVIIPGHDNVMFSPGRVF